MKMSLSRISQVYSNVRQTCRCKQSTEPGSLRSCFKVHISSIIWDVEKDTTNTHYAGTDGASNQISPEHSHISKPLLATRQPSKSMP